MNKYKLRVPDWTIYKMRECEVDFKYILYEKKEGIATITLNRSEKLNALNQTLMRELEMTLKDAEADDEVRVVVIRGEGRSFSVGADMSVREAPVKATPKDWFHWELEWTRRYRIIMDMHKPVIAAVQGYCLALGLELAACCDITIASEDALFGEPEIRHVSGPPVYILGWMIGRKKAMEMALTGDMINAKEAYEWGLVNKVVPREKLDDEVYKLAKKLTMVDPAAIEFNKAAINKQYEIMGIKMAQDYSTAVKCLTMLQGPHTEIGKKMSEAMETGKLKEFLKERDQKFKELTG